MANTKNNGKMPFLYIFTGYGEIDVKTGKIKAEAGSFDLVKNRVIFTKETVITKINKTQNNTELKYTAWCTNINGVLQKVSDKGFGTKPGRSAKIEKSRNFYLPPKDMVLQTMYSRKQGWVTFFSDYFKQNPNVEFSLLSTTSITKDKFRKPDPNRKSEEEKAYTKWYNNIKNVNEKTHGYLLLKTRAIVFVFTNTIFKDAIINVVTPDQQEHNDIKITKTPEGVIYTSLVHNGDTIKLTQGLYKIKVIISKDYKPEKFYKKQYDKKTNELTYELSQQVDFNIKNIAGEFDVVCCDPISLEESILTSFSSTYPHLIQAVKEREPYSTYKYTKKGEDKIKVLPSSLKVIADRMDWVNTKSKMALELLDADGIYPRGWIIGNIIFRDIKKRNILEEKISETVSLAFNAKQSINAWNSFAESMNTHVLGDVSDYLWLDKIDDGSMAKVFLKGQKLDNLKKALSNSKLGKEISLFKVNTEKFIKKIGLDSMGKAVGWLDVLITAKSGIDSIGKITESADNIEDNKKELFKKVDSYIDLHGEESFNRVDMAEIEKYHLCTILEMAGMDGNTIKLFKDVINTLIAGACVIPPVATAGLLITFLKSTYELWGAGVNFLDTVLNDSAMQDYEKNLCMLGKMANISEENRNLMDELDLDNTSHRLILQMCIRYEAVSGLVRLFTRAGISVAEDEDRIIKIRQKLRYEEVIKKYKIDDYIDRYLLNDGWMITKDGFNPVGLDEDWFYEHELDDVINADADAEHRFEWFNDTKESLFKSLNVKSDFQKIYPVHCMNSMNYEALSKDFQSVYTKIHSDCIEHSAIYYRKQGMTDEKAGNLEDNGWISISGDAKSLNEMPAITPLDQIRVLIVLKKEIREGIYPASIRINRVDGKNIEGPEYKRFIHELNSSLLDSEKTKWENRLGCVFYPFYYLSKEKIFGIKPLALDILEPMTKYKLKFFDRMRYSISAIVGTGKPEKFIDTGKIIKDESVKSGFNEFPVTIDYSGPKSPVKEAMKKMLDSGFLALRASRFEYPELFKINSFGKGAGPIYMRFSDKGPYKLCPPICNFNMSVNGNVNFWESPVEIIMMVWCSAKYTNFERYDELDIPVNDLPIHARMVNYEGKDTKGPLVKAKLNYLGTIEKSSDLSSKYEFTKKTDDTQYPQFKPLLDTLATDSKERMDLAKQIGFIVEGRSARHLDGTYDLFAAHFKMNYTTPDDKKVMGLRPFSKALTDDNKIKFPAYYRYSFIDIRMPARIGLDVPELFGVDNSNRVREYEFKFQAPNDYSTISKWSGIKDIDQWIGDVPKMIIAE